MKPQIHSTDFGVISIDGENYEHDVVIRLDGTVEKRKKKLSKEVYGTAHILSRAEAEHIYEEGAQRLIFGSGQEGISELSDEAAVFFESKGCAVEVLATPEAIRAWNRAKDRVIGVFHVTC